MIRQCSKIGLGGNLSGRMSIMDSGRVGMGVVVDELHTMLLGVLGLGRMACG